MNEYEILAKTGWSEIAIWARFECHPDKSTEKRIIFFHFRDQYAKNLEGRKSQSPSYRDPYSGQVWSFLLVLESESEI